MKKEKCSNHKMEIVEYGSTGYIEHCSNCKESRMYDSNYSNIEISKFLAIFFLTCIIVSFLWALIEKYL